MACKVYNDFKFKTLRSSEAIHILFNYSLKLWLWFYTRMEWSIFLWFFSVQSSQKLEAKQFWRIWHIEWRKQTVQTDSTVDGIFIWINLKEQSAAWKRDILFLRRTAISTLPLPAGTGAGSSSSIRLGDQRTPSPLERCDYCQTIPLILMVEAFSLYV